MVEEKFDLIILGGGISGSLLAISLLKKQPSFKILILEKSIEFPQKVGESTSDITALFFRRFGVDHLLKDVVEKTGLRFLFNEDLTEQKEAVAEYSSPTYKNGPNNGFQLNRKVFDEKLLKEADKLGATVFRPVELTDSKFENFHCELDLVYNDEKKKVSSRWFADASGRIRYIHNKLAWKDVPVVLNTGTVFAHFTNIVSPEKWHLPINEHWKKYAVGDQSYSTLHFMRENRWWWLIRIDDQTTSIGVVYDKEFVSCDDPEKFFADQITTDPQLKSITEGSERTKVVHFETVPYQSEKLYDNGIALIGDSGAFVDPLVSPGIELICQQTLWLSDLLVKDFETKEFDAKKWKKYNRIFSKAYSDRMAIYKNGYRIMNSYDLSANWLQLGLFAYFGIWVFRAYLIPKKLKYPFTINWFGRIGFSYMVWRLNSIRKKRKRQNRSSITRPNAITNSGFRYPEGIFIYTIPFRMFFRWLYNYLKLELIEMRYFFKRSKKVN